VTQIKLFSTCTWNLYVSDRVHAK